MKLAKLIGNCIALAFLSGFLFVLSICIEIFLSDWITSLTPNSSERWLIGIDLFIMIVLAPVVSTILIIGIIGGTITGRCHRDKKPAGYIAIAGVGCIHLFYFARNMHPYSIYFLLTIFGVVALVFLGSLTYRVTCKWSLGKTMSGVRPT